MLSELLVFRPLRTSSPLAKLVASLGILLILQATVLLWFGSSAKQIPSVFPTNIVHVFGTTIPANRFWMAAIVVLIALALAGLYRWTRFGLATRAAAENEVYGMLAGLVAEPAVDGQHGDGVGTGRGDGHHRRSACASRLEHPRALRRAGAGRCAVRRVHVARIACLAGFGIGIGQSLMQYLSTLSWFPTDKGQPLPGVQALLTFVLLVIALSLRGASLPTRGELVEKRLPSAPRPQRLARPAVLLAVVGVVLLIVLPFGYRQALMLSMVGMVVCLSLVVITGFVGQMSLAQVTLAGVVGFVVSQLFVHAGIGFPWAPLAGSVAGVIVGLIVGVSALRVRGASLAVVTLAGVIAIEQFGFANSTWGAGPSGSPVGQPKLFGFCDRRQRVVPRARRQAPEPSARLRLSRRRRSPCACSSPTCAAPCSVSRCWRFAPTSGQPRPPASTSPGSRSRPTRCRRSSPARQDGCTHTTSARSAPPGSES